MSTFVIETTDPDYWPCPEGMDGHPTDDSAGGPCSRCWDRVLSEGRPDPDAYDGWLDR